MSQHQLFFDASSILILVKESRDRAPDILLSGSTISLAYYEVGNALWRECFLLQRITLKEAGKLLESIFALIQAMDVAVLDDEEVGSVILNMAGEQNITFYDAAYLTETQRSNRTLVTDDVKLANVAKIVGVKTLASKDIAANMS